MKLLQEKTSQFEFSEDYIFQFFKRKTPSQECISFIQLCIDWSEIFTTLFSKNASRMLCYYTLSKRNWTKIIIVCILCYQDLFRIQDGSEFLMSFNCVRVMRNTKNRKFFSIKGIWMVAVFSKPRRPIFHDGLSDTSIPVNADSRTEFILRLADSSHTAYIYYLRDSPSAARHERLHN